MATAKIILRGLVQSDLDDCRVQVLAAADAAGYVSREVTAVAADGDDWTFTADIVFNDNASMVSATDQILDYAETKSLSGGCGRQY